MTYPLLIAGLLLAAVAVRVAGEVVARRRGHPIPILPTIVAAVALLLLTAAFDNAMIASGLFAYADGHISGVRIGLAPIEDFAYPLAVAILVPGVWELSRRERRDVHA
jgi:lycopene cyclase domain-containing protein